MDPELIACLQQAKVFIFTFHLSDISEVPKVIRNIKDRVKLARFRNRLEPTELRSWDYLSQDLTQHTKTLALNRLVRTRMWATALYTEPGSVASDIRLNFRFQQMPGVKIIEEDPQFQTECLKQRYNTKINSNTGTGTVTFSCKPLRQGL